MSSFKGRYSYSVDEKGRVALPAKLRSNLATSAKGNFVITRGFERCLYVYPQDEWNKLEQFVRSLSFLDAQHRFYARTLFERANDSKIDGQSRITIPPELMEFAGIKNEVLILGVWIEWRSGTLWCMKSIRKIIQIHTKLSPSKFLSRSNSSPAFIGGAHISYSRSFAGGSFLPPYSEERVLC